MTISRTFLRAALIAMMAPAASTAQDLVLTNARIYTVNAERAWAEALRIDDDGVIAAVGSETSVLSTSDPAAIIVDMGGRMILPGFQDIHLHAIEAGMNELLCDFEAFDTLEGLRDTVLDCADYGDTGYWVLGANVNMAHLMELHDNPIAVLDEIVPDRPVLILDDIGHGAWANSHALAAVGYDTAPDLPDGNIILVNAAGTPNGVVLENAPHKLRTAAFLPTETNLAYAYDSLLAAVTELNRHGITSVSDAGGYWTQGHHLIWDRAEESNALTLRASNAFYIYPDRPMDAQLAELKTLYHNDPERLVRFNVAKIYVDGILSQATGAMLQPYEAGLGLAPSDDHGYLYFGIDRLFRLSRELSAAGFQLHFHVTGNHSTRLALDAIAQSDAASGPHRLTHIYLADSADHPRFRELDVIADFQLAPSALSAGYRRSLTTFIGDRAANLMPAGDLVAAGATVTLSSDWDADEVNPMIKIAAAVGRPRNGLPDVATAIEAMTINGAYALRHDDMTGSLEVGKFADIVVLSGNILEMPVADIAKVKIDATLFQGEVVHDRIGLFQ